MWLHVGVCGNLGEEVGEREGGRGKREEEAEEEYGEKNARTKNTFSILPVTYRQHHLLLTNISSTS